MSLARDIADLGSVTTRLDTVGASEGALSNRNLIINGAAQIYQRGSGTIVQSGAVFGVDRFKVSTANLDNLAGTFTQDSDSPDGFGNSMKVTTTTAESVIASDEYVYISQILEAQNLQQLAYGTSAAKQVTLSFYVKSSVTGTFAVGLYKPDNTAQIHNLTYTINSASTWEYKTLTFAANTLSGGAIDDNNGVGLYVNWHLAAGSGFKGGGSTSGWTSYANNKWSDGQATDAVITTTNATFQLTGCQLEVGDTATDFEHPRSFGDEMARCQRYYHRVESFGTFGNEAYKRYGNGVYYSATAAEVMIPLPVMMRAEPTFENTGTSTDYAFYDGTVRSISSSLAINAASDPNYMVITGTTASTTLGNGAIFLSNNNTNSFIAASAEL
jgi:hypothetical protein